MLPQQEPPTPEAIAGEPEMGFILPGLGFELKKDIETLEEQVGLINTNLTGIESRIEKVETSIENVQTGFINKNVGSQILSGDVGMLTVLCITAMGLIFLAYWQRRQIMQLKSDLEEGKYINEQ